MASTLRKFSPAERRNWGYWDGFNARQRGRLPMWARYASAPHPFDRQYGAAYWQGWYGELHPNTGDPAPTGPASPIA
jgi:hypothetical protein